ncbi:sensor histidine kinase [Falsibacillus albus]|uniref:histidine kinase n=1 Tax=Falsibacillus albus TaxID=2478915 RepID=A0A3L7JTC2_9BACI|nr:HAMP domain-containing sensor histidine kinase [Falsibacillus albus]RLQ94093.1 sensor histidine kinase [Falsibacillus albus]
MFEKLRKQLTRSYSLWLIMTVIIVFIVLFFSFRARIYDIEKQDVKDILAYEQQEHKTDLNNTPRNSRSLYVVAVKDQKNAIHIKEQGDSPSAVKEIKAFFLDLPCCQEAPKILKLKKQKEDEQYMYASSPIEVDGKKTGELFVAKDLSTVHEQMEKWFYMLAFIAIIVFFVSIFIGDRLAHRAMLPIIQNVERQQKFSADASHELRTPLSIFSASVEVLEEEEKERLSPFGLTVLQDLKDESSLMKKLVNDLLTLTKYDQHQTQLDTHPFNIGALMAQIKKEYDYLSLNRYILYINKANADLNLNGDQLKIKQLLYILLDNAIKFTDDGGTINLILSQTTSHILIKVIDDGIGMDERDVNKVFERFFQVDQSRSSQHGGSGLGLSIAKAIVEAHGGTIEVDSKLGVGTTVNVYLPK